MCHQMIRFPVMSHSSQLGNVWTQERMLLQVVRNEDYEVIDFGYVLYCVCVYVNQPTTFSSLYLSTHQAPR
jgi:hypothetical protein